MRDKKEGDRYAVLPSRQALWAPDAQSCRGLWKAHIQTQTGADNTHPESSTNTPGPWSIVSPAAQALVESHACRVPSLGHFQLEEQSGLPGSGESSGTVSWKPVWHTESSEPYGKDTRRAP